MGSLRFEGNDHNVTITHNNLLWQRCHAIRIDAKGTPGSDDGFVINNNNIYDNCLEESGIAIQDGRRPIHWHAQLNKQLLGLRAAAPAGLSFSGSGDGITADSVSVNVTPG